NKKHVEPCGLFGGLALWWNDEVIVDVLYCSKNLIHVKLVFSSFEVLKFVTFMYGPLKEKEREKVWDKMRNLVRVVNGTWVCMGDFNDMALVMEKEGGKPRSVRKIMGFQSLFI